MEIPNEQTSIEEAIKTLQRDFLEPLKTGSGVVIETTNGRQIWTSQDSPEHLTKMITQRGASITYLSYYVNPNGIETILWMQ